jgi:hypothetical protein
VAAVAVSVAVSVVVAVFPFLLAFVTKNCFTTCLSRSRTFRGRLLELHSPKVITVP